MVIFCSLLLRIISLPYGTQTAARDLEHLVSTLCIFLCCFLLLILNIRLCIQLPGPHNGAVWDLDPSWDSKYLVTACADANARLFEVNTGKYIARMPHKGVVRSVKWGDGSQFFATAADPFTSRDLGTISIFEFPTEEQLQEGMFMQFFFCLVG